MGAPPPSRPTSAEWTYSGDAVLDADPATFRGYAENVNKIGKNLRGDMMGPVMRLHGGGEDVALSTGGFPEGQHCDRLNSRNASEMTTFLHDLATNFRAIPSASYILADLYETADGDSGASLDAVGWAFGRAGVDKPANLPGYIDGDKTIASESKGPEAGTVESEVLISSSTHSGATVATYRTADGGTRTVITTPRGVTETGYAKDGTISYEVTTDPEGGSTTHNYGPDGQLVSTTERTHATSEHGNVTHQKTTVVTDPAGEKPTTTTDHMVTTEHSDETQTRHYYTTEKIEGENGETSIERSDERYVGRQPDAMTTEDWMQRNEKAFEQARLRAGA